MNLSLYNNYDPNCLTMVDCQTTVYEKVLQECKQVKFEYIWFFVIGFLFSNVGYFLINLNMDPKLKTFLIDGLKFAGFVISALGCFLFLLGGYT